VNPPLTTVRQPARELGRDAAGRLFEMIDGHARRNQTYSTLEFEPIVFPTDLIIRESSGPPPQ
jgi:DNA-binding LacI/PurR family transcriptional regulator